jgi:hypothetical protein
MISPRGFKITIVAEGGEMEGLRFVEKSGWSGRGVVCPRSLFQAARLGDEFAKPAVYILTGPSERSTLTRIYVGEGDPVRPRLDSHARDKKKHFWTTLILFCATNEALNKAHLQYLESRLLKLARDAQKAELDNKNKPELPTLSKADLAEAEAFLGEMLLCLPFIGVHAFEPANPLSTRSERLELRGKGIVAWGFDTARGFWVEKNSRAVASVVRSMHAYAGYLRKDLLERGIFKAKNGFWELTKDHQFDSPTAAASVMLGKSTNGRIRWKNKSGRTLRELQDATTGGTPKKYLWN